VGDPAIVLLHGLLFDGGMWRGLLEPLEAIGRVLVLDGPGHGRSEPAPRFTLEEHADALHDAFGESGVERAVVVGLSWGGMVGMRLALQHPESVAGLVLLDTSAEAETLAKRVRNRAFIAMHRRVGMPLPLWKKEIAPELFAPRTLVERPELVEASWRRCNGFDREGLCRACSAVVVERKDIVSELGRIRAPTLVACGSEDRATPVAKSRKIADAIPGAKLVILDGLGHMSVLEDPAAVAARLVPFVRDCIEGRTH